MNNTCEFIIENGILKKFKGRKKIIEIPEEAKIIDGNAFKNHTVKKSIRIPNSVSKIGNGTFGDFVELEEIIVPSSIVSVGMFSFNTWIDMNGAHYANASYLGNSNNPYYMLLKINDKENFIEIHKDTKIIYEDLDRTISKLPIEKYTKYDNALYLGNVDNPYQLLVKSIDENISSCCIHKDTVIIGPGAFQDCKNIEYLDIPDNVYSIGSAAFIRCESLKSIHLPNSLKCIPELMLKWCENLEKIIIPDTVLHIDDGAFWGCEKLKEVIIPEGVLSLGFGAFGTCHSLQKLVLPSSLIDIGSCIVNSAKITTDIIVPEFSLAYWQRDKLDKF